MFEFGERSTTALSTCHPDLITIAKEVIRLTNIDFGISEGHRSIERQYKLYLEGKSKIDGVNVKGKHNYSPSYALDFYIYHPNLTMRRKMAYDKVHLAYVAGIFVAVAKSMYREQKIRHLIRWGANWDRDGVIDFDQNFDDYPHVELYEP